MESAIALSVFFLSFYFFLFFSLSLIFLYFFSGTPTASHLYGCQFGRKRQKQLRQSLSRLKAFQRYGQSLCGFQTSFEWPFLSSSTKSKEFEEKPLQAFKKPRSIKRPCSCKSSTYCLDRQTLGDFTMGWWRFTRFFIYGCRRDARTDNSLWA